MPPGPTTEYRMEIAATAIICGLIAFAIYLVLQIVLRGQGGRGAILLSLTGLAAIAIGLSISSAVRLVGLTRGTDTADLALGTQFGGTAIALAFLALALVSHRRRTSVR